MYNALHYASFIHNQAMILFCLKQRMPPVALDASGRNALDYLLLGSLRVDRTEHGSSVDISGGNCGGNSGLVGGG